MVIRLIACVFLFHLLTIVVGDVEVRIDNLETQVKELRDELHELTQTIENLEKSVVKQNIADQKLDKCIANILLNNQEKASMYWKEVVTYLDGSEFDSHLKNLVENTYLGNSDNFYYVLEFLARNELFIGFTMLFKELEQHRELHNGQEIFALAHQIKILCGIKNKLYEGIPKAVRDILAGPVILKNIDNNGYIMVDKHNNFSCENQSTCYRNMKSQVFVYRLPSTTTMEDLKNDTAAHWHFIGPNNITELSLGFYIKNMVNDLFFVFYQRPPTSFLKENATIESYFYRDMQAQFLPALVPNASSDENLIRIGIREKMFRKISYFNSGEFSKKITRLDLSRMPIFRDDVKGFVWEVTPVNDDNLDNTIEGGEINEKCRLTL